MLELNQSNTDEILIKDVNEDTFMDDVIEMQFSSISKTKKYRFLKLSVLSKDVFSLFIDDS